MLKLDFRNAFNSIRRDKMLKSVQEKAQVIYPLVHAAYSTPSFLFLGERIIQSADSLGPLLFCLAIHDVLSNLRSEFTAFYLDDGTLGGSLEDIKADLAYIEDTAKDINLFLNCSKSEIICVDDSICSSMLSVTPSIQVIDPSDATLLGSPIGSTASIDAVLQSKINHLKFLGTRLKLLHTHDALCLLRNASSCPKFFTSYALLLASSLIFYLFFMMFKDHFLKISATFIWTILAGCRNLSQSPLAVLE